MNPSQLLEAWLLRQLPAPAGSWLRESISRLRGANTDRDLFLTVSLVPRKLGKADLDLGEADLRDATRARAGWDPSGWSVDQAGRVLLLLAGGSEGSAFALRLDQLCATADIAELVAFYRGLPLYPDPSRHVLRAAEGVRTSMKPVFEAVAHRNPYPSEQFSEAAWNQMALKAVFIGSTLDPIIGLDARANPSLARMLCDYAHERWSAGRPVSPELWRCVGPFAAGPMLEDLARVLTKGTDLEHAAAALALFRSPDPEASMLLGPYAELVADIASGQLNWQRLASPGSAI